MSQTRWVQSEVTLLFKVLQMCQTQKAFHTKSNKKDLVRPRHSSTKYTLVKSRTLTWTSEIEVKHIYNMLGQV